MDEFIRVAAIQKRLDANDYFLNPLSDANAREDIAFLLALVGQLEDKLQKAKRKNDVLSQQVLELTQEIDNVKGDFGSQR